MPTNPSGRARYLSVQVEQSLADEAVLPAKPYDELLTQSFDAINFILSRASFPLNCRAFIDALIGTSRGRSSWFVATDPEIGKRMLGIAAEGKTEASIRKRVQRARKDMLDWQELSGVQMFLYMPGGKNWEGYHPSEYKLPLLTLGILALEAVAGFDSVRSHRELQRQSKSYAASLKSGNASKIERFRRPQPDMRSRIKRSLTIATRELRNAERLMSIVGEDEKPVTNALTDLAVLSDDFIVESYCAVNYKTQG